MRCCVLGSSLLGLFAVAQAGRSVQANALLNFLHPDFDTNFQSAPFIGEESSFEAREEISAPDHQFLTPKTKKFAVNGTGIPDVNWDVGESYAGILPISDKKDEESNLYFWFFPTTNPDHKNDKEITIWLNGGPGCSSLLGLLQENGPFLWQPGTLKPVKNPWAFNKLTHMIWIEQPTTVGFSKGNTTITNEDELAEQFMGFWKNFFDTFDLHGYKVNIVAESYGGYYGPYISSHFLDAKDKKYFDLNGLMVVDGIMFDNQVQNDVIAEAYIRSNSQLMPLEDADMATLHNVSEHCGYNDYLKKYFTYPPAGLQPYPSPGLEIVNGTLEYKNGCDIGPWEYGAYFATRTNPCFNIYNVADHCPFVYDPLGDAKPYFNRLDVKKAIHAPLEITWEACSNTAFIKDIDESPPPAYKQLPHVIDSTKNVILHNGAFDYILPAIGILLGVQNMTFGGKLGFHSRPVDPFYVPNYGLDLNGQKNSYAKDQPAGFGVMGTTHTERGLTITVTQLAGHEGPEYAAAAMLRELEKLLGRISSLSEVSPFTFDPIKHIKQDKNVGAGTYKVPKLEN